jgi:hypothetical protein
MLVRKNAKYCLDKEERRALSVPAMYSQRRIVIISSCLKGPPGRCEGVVPAATLIDSRRVPSDKTRGAEGL